MRERRQRSIRVALVGTILSVVLIATGVTAVASGAAATRRLPVKIIAVTPNPFIPNGHNTTAFRVALGGLENLQYRIENAKGKTILGPHKVGVIGPGEHVYRWNGKNHAGTIVSNGIYTILVTTSTSGGSPSHGSANVRVRIGPAPKRPPRTTDRVTYTVTGADEFGDPGMAFITLQTPTGSEQADANLPWRKTQTFKIGDFLYVSPQNDFDSGYVKCTISANGKIISSNTATGAYTIATCDGSAP